MLRRQLSGGLEWVALAAALLAGLVTTRGADVDAGTNTEALHTGSPAELIFHTGFEQTSIDDPGHRAPPISGRDDAYAVKSDWQDDFVGDPRIDNAYIQYVGKQRSDLSKQMMSIVDDPLGAGRGRVLHFFNRQTKPGGSTYTRTQARVNFNRESRWTEFFQRWKMAVGDELTAYSDKRLSVQLFTEIRTKDQEVDGHRLAFRVNLNLINHGDGLAWYVFGQTISTAPGPRYKTLWRQANSTVPVPIGEWMTLEMYYRNGQGREDQGAFQLAMTDHEGQRFTIFDIRNRWTDHPNKTEHFLLSWYKPFVIYCHDRVLKEIRQQGPNAGIRTYYDDFELWTAKPPDAGLADPAAPPRP